MSANFPSGPRLFPSKPMSRRESKVIKTVACPHCGAPVGQPCRLLTDADRATARGRLFAHGDRRRAWQEWKRSRPTDFYALPLPYGAGRISPQSRPARDAARRLLTSAREEDGHFIVPVLRDAIEILTAEGWKVQ